MTRSLKVAVIGVLALGAAALSIGDVSAMPVSMAPAIDSASPAASQVEQVRYIRHRGVYRRYYGYRRGYGYRRPLYRRGLPGHPIRRLLRSL